VNGLQLPEGCLATLAQAASSRIETAVGDDEDNVLAETLRSASPIVSLDEGTSYNLNSRVVVVVWFYWLSQAQSSVA